MKIKNIITIATAVLLASCGSSKTAAGQDTITTQQVAKQTTTQQKATTGQKAATQQNTTTQQKANTQQQINVTKASYVCDMDMGLGVGSDHYNLGGKVCMRQNEVVRLNLTFMGFVEVGVIEFTPDYVLVVSRLSKEYCKADYSLDVLKKNDITFDKIWTMADTELQSSRNKGDNSLGKLVQNLINTNMKGGKKVTVDIEFGEPNYKKSFDSHTEVSSRYKEVPSTELMSKLMAAMK